MRRGRTSRLHRYRSAQRKGAGVGVACWVVTSYVAQLVS